MKRTGSPLSNNEWFRHGQIFGLVWKDSAIKSTSHETWNEWCIITIVWIIQYSFQFSDFSCLSSV